MRREKQLRLNAEALLGEYLNGMCDCGEEEYPPMSRDECREWVVSQVYDMTSYGDGHIKYRDGICDDLRFLGNDTIFSIIDKVAEECGVLGAV